ncbi:MAG: hypothetical protein AMXMBFR34_17170 [Myxococcaceae bacterium]
MKYLKFALFGLVPLLAAASWLRASLIDDRDTFHAFCNATRRAEPWSQVQARATEKGWAFVPQSAAGKAPEEHLAEVDVFGYRLGCTVVVRDGRVWETRYGELPVR